MDETYIEVKGEGKYLARAVDSEGNTFEFMLSAKTDARTAERFFCNPTHITTSGAVVTQDAPGSKQCFSSQISGSSLNPDWRALIMSATAQDIEDILRLLAAQWAVN